MKKISGIILSLLLAVLSTSMLQAQDIQLGVGVKGGATYSQFYASQTGQYHYNDAMGYTGGLYIPLAISIAGLEGLSVQPEVLYSYRPFAASYYLESKRYTTKTEYHFMDIPLVVQYKMLDLIKVELGASASYLLDAGRITLEDENGHRLMQEPRPVTEPKTTFEKPRDWTFAAIGGASYTFDFGLEVDGRVAYQFSEAYNYDRLAENVKPITYQLLVSYKLPFIDFQF